MKLLSLVRDWYRGYTDADRASMLAKLSKPTRPGQVVWLSDAEIKAVTDDRTPRSHVVEVA